MKLSLPVDDRGRKKAFSLVEVLVVIAVIAILTAVVTPRLSSFAGQAERNKARRNAQSIASTVAEAVGAGNTTILTAGDLDTAVSLVLAGLPVKEVINLPVAKVNLSAEEADKAKPYLSYENQIIVYKP